MKKEKVKLRPVVYTIGHSTRPVAGFIEILKAFGIEEVVDVRTIPRSRHNPQFNREELQESLRRDAIGYVHMRALGGLRRASRDSVNTAWQNLSFRGFADYMQTEAFETGLRELIDRARQKTTVIMCAEAVPWRCHRSLIGDALLTRGLEVKDITGIRSCRDHTLTPWAKVDGERITYPGEEEAPAGNES